MVVAGPPSGCEPVARVGRAPEPPWQPDSRSRSVEGQVTSTTISLLRSQRCITKLRGSNLDVPWQQGCISPRGEVSRVVPAGCTTHVRSVSPHVPSKQSVLARRNRSISAERVVSTLRTQMPVRSASKGRGCYVLHPTPPSDTLGAIARTNSPLGQRPVTPARQSSVARRRQSLSPVVSKPAMSTESLSNNFSPRKQRASDPCVPSSVIMQRQAVFSAGSSVHIGACSPLTLVQSKSHMVHQGTTRCSSPRAYSNPRQHQATCEQGPERLGSSCKAGAMTPVSVAHPIGARGCYKYGINVRVHSPRNVGHLASRCGQAPAPKESVVAARAAASEVFMRTTKDPEMRSQSMTCYRDPPVKRLFDFAGEELARTPPPSVSPRGIIQTDAFGGHLLPGMANSTSAHKLFSRSRINPEEVQSHKREEQTNGHQDHEEKGEVEDETDAEALTSTTTYICEDPEEGSGLATLRDNVAEIEQMLCMVGQQLGEDAALPFFGPLSVVQRGLSALEMWQDVEDNRRSLQG